MTTDHDQTNLRRRLLVAGPGFIAPLALLLLIVWYVIGAWAGHYTLRPVHWALGDDGSLALFVAVGVAFSLLLLVPPLLAARPGRLRPWAAAAAVAIELLPLWASLDLIASRNGWGWILLALFAYTPIIVVARLMAQRQHPPSRKPQATAQGP